MTGCGSVPVHCSQLVLVILDYLDVFESAQSNATHTNAQVHIRLNPGSSSARKLDHRDSSEEQRACSTDRVGLLSPSSWVPAGTCNSAKSDIDMPV